MRAVVRPEVYDAYWRFAARRNEILMNRIRGLPAPWTDDPILQRFKFCNTFRAADRVSQYLIRDVIYGDRAAGLTPEDDFMRIVLFRLFSKERTWEALEGATGGLRCSNLDVSALGDMLEGMRAEGPIYTAAFILAAPKGFGYKAKHRNHLALVAHMFRKGGLGSALSRARSLDDVFESLTEYPMIGPFLGYQIAIDLNYSEHLSFDEDEFTMPGPGALRGIAKVFKDTGGESAQALIGRMVDRQEEEFARLGLDFDGLFGRRLHAIDCQGLFCETDKYSREAFPELKSNRVRIKQEYRPDPRPLVLTFPPKWGIDANATAFAADGSDDLRREVDKSSQRPIDDGPRSEQLALA
ncbi:MAG: putative DNA base hypermodification protein [Actinomycetota bacterium]|nr:putative DNA base hypermodification protein [Actinomycetota bacterium]